MFLFSAIPARSFFNRVKKMLQNHEIDMLHGSLWDKIVWFTIPLALTGVFQQLLNAADVAVLGQFVGKNAMAAVGNNTALVGLILSLFMGLSLGANVVIAQNIGAEKFDKVRTTVHTAFLMSLITGIGMVAVSELIVSPIFYLLSVPPEVEEAAEIYLRIFLPGIPGIIVYNFEAAILRSRGDTRTPLIALIFASTMNIALNLVFVLKFDWGIEGVAVATDIANTCAAIMLFVVLLKTDGYLRLDFSEMKIDRAGLKEIISIGLPAGVQGMVFSLSNVLIQSAINSLGPNVMAGSAAAFTIEINMFCIMNAFGQAATTFVGQNYGAGNLARCKDVTRTAIKIGSIVIISLSILILYFVENLIGFYSSDPAVIETGAIRLWFFMSAEIVNVFMEVLAGSLRGYGFSTAPAVITLIFACGIRVFWVFVIFEMYPSYKVLMAVYPVTWIVTTIVLVFAYRFYMKHLKVVSL